MIFLGLAFESGVLFTLSARRQLWYGRGDTLGGVILSQILKVSRPRLNDIVHGRRAVTTDTALRLGYYFGTTPEFWLNLQTRYDLDVAEHTLRRKIEREVTPRAA